MLATFPVCVALILTWIVRVFCREPSSQEISLEKDYPFWGVVKWKQMDMTLA